MNRLLGVLGALAFLILGTVPALPQATVRPCITTGPTLCPPVSASNPMPVTGTVTATLSLTTNAPVAPATATATNSTLIGAEYRSTNPTFTNTQQGSLQVGTRGGLKINVLGSDSTSGAGVGGNSADAQAVQTGLNTWGFNSVYNGTTWDRTRGDTTGAWTVGNVASAAADSGNPVKTGGRYNTTPIVLTNGQRGDTQVDVAGYALTTGTASVIGGASFLNIAAGQATTVVKNSAGKLYAIILNSAATATNTTVLYDDAAGVGTVIGRPAVVTATVPTTLSYGPAGLAFANGLTIITGAANGGDMTVIFK